MACPGYVSVCRSGRNTVHSAMAQCDVAFLYRPVMSDLPPLESLRFFDAAARHESFARAADELGVTPAAVAYRIRLLEAHLQAPLFYRFSRGVGLNLRGRKYHEDVQRILRDIRRCTRLRRREIPGMQP